MISTMSRAVFTYSRPSRRRNFNDVRSRRGGGGGKKASRFRSERKAEACGLLIDGRARIQPWHPTSPPSPFRRQPLTVLRARGGRHPGDRMHAQCAARRDDEHAPNSMHQHRMRGGTDSFDNRRRNVAVRDPICD